MIGDEVIIRDDPPTTEELGEIIDDFRNYWWNKRPERKL